MKSDPTPSHTPFAVSNPTASEPDAWEREVARPLRAAELRSKMNDLSAALEAPALGLGERAGLKRQIEELQRRIDALGVGPDNG